MPAMHQVFRLRSNPFNQHSGLRMVLTFLKWAPMAEFPGRDFSDKRVTGDEYIWASSGNKRVITRDSATGSTRLEVWSNDQLESTWRSYTTHNGLDLSRALRNDELLRVKIDCSHVSDVAEGIIIITCRTITVKWNSRRTLNAHISAIVKLSVRTVLDGAMCR